MPEETEKKATFKITVPPGMKIKVAAGVMGDSGRKHDEDDQIPTRKPRTILVTKDTEYVETGVDEKRAALFEPYKARGVKIEKEK